jgi:hypothetical protein
MLFVNLQDDLRDLLQKSQSANHGGTEFLRLLVKKRLTTEGTENTEFLKIFLCLHWAAGTRVNSVVKMVRPHPLPESRF